MTRFKEKTDASHPAILTDEMKNSFEERQE